MPQQTSYQAFMKLLVRWSTPLCFALAETLRERMETSLRPVFRVAGYAVYGGDGSRLELPRTASNETRFSPAKFRKPRSRSAPRSKALRRKRTAEMKANVPQVWLTTLWHAGTGLPWDWRIGPSDSSERHHLLEMIDDLPPDALIAADAGFVGYEFWSELFSRGRPFLIRVGANVRLLRKLGLFRERDHTVYLWPQRVAESGQPPLVLRLVVVRGERHPWYLVTSVLDRTRLSDQQVASIYGLRWGVELYFRHFKQTFERRKLRSHKAEHAECEVRWSMIGLWAMLLHSQHTLRRRGIGPAQLSVAGVLRAYRAPMREYKSNPDPGESLWELLDVARIDPYERRNKSSRGFPRKKYHKPPGIPKLQTATREQVLQAKRLAAITPQRLTA